jgi:hypothetical protein
MKVQAKYVNIDRRINCAGVPVENFDDAGNNGIHRLRIPIQKPLQKTWKTLNSATENVLGIFSDVGLDRGLNEKILQLMTIRQE